MHNLNLNRRLFLKSSILMSALGKLSYSPMLPAQTVPADPNTPTDNLRKEEHGLFYLPPGFQCEVVQRTGEKMSDGLYVPGMPDGMSCFPGPNQTFILMRNHELDETEGAISAYGANIIPPSSRPHRYDDKSFGGVTRIVFDARTMKVLSSNLVLEGSNRNCAGGNSPWGWLSCEEDMTPGHGYVFLCSPDASDVEAPRLIKGYGRFNHEAATVDAQTHIAYLTEDRADGCFYRFVPDHFDQPFVGKLQALKIKNKWKHKTYQQLQTGDRLSVEWVTLNDPDPVDDVLRLVAQAQGAAIFKRGEGLWIDPSTSQVYFSCTTGGPVEGGQIFSYLASSTNTDEGELLLVAQSTNRRQLDMPDNLTVSPWNSLFVAEDGDGAPFIRVIDEKGRIRNFAQNALSTSELSGVCFAPDGKSLFVNIQKNGLTVRIWGPFEQWHKK